jgi:serine/threonine protein phosphatase PrpC
VSNFFKKLFGQSNTTKPVEPVQEDTILGEVVQPELVPAEEKQSVPDSDIATVPLATAPLNGELDIEQTIQPPQFIVGIGHSVGMQREHNEDAIFSISSNVLTDSRSLPFGIFVIADGMGGHQHGEIASGLAVRAVSSYLVRKLFLPVFSIKPETPGQSLQEMLQESVMEAHRAITKDAAGGGTTLTLAVIMGEQLIIAHIGDSRAYAIYTDGSLRVLTRDHSLVKRLEELGQITSDEASIHPQRNVLYRALGQGEPSDPDIATYPLPQGGHLMLCSDGLWGLVPEQELVRIIKESSTPEIACQRMVAAANDAGGPDNISVLLVRIPN